MSGTPSNRAADDGLEAWLSRELAFAAKAMMASVSATGLIRRRATFGQTIAPRRGSVVASPEFADYDPDPDYFFHWLRDSALVMDAIRESMVAVTVGAEGHVAFADFVRFSLSLGNTQAAQAPMNPDSVAAAYRQYLRPAQEIAEATGERLLMEARFNPDGSLDILKWARPQLDGPALRALTLMRYWPHLSARDEETARLTQELIRRDLEFVQKHCHDASFDIWEEEFGTHYYTRVVHLGAIVHGAQWLQSVGAAAEARGLEANIDQIRASLDAHWSPERGLYLARSDRMSEGADKDPDVAVILGVLHAALPDGAHSVLDPKVQATLSRAEEVFAANFAINRPPGGHRPALGRYPGDRYFGGGAFYLTTLAAAEFYFRMAEAVASGKRFAALPENAEFLRSLSRLDAHEGFAVSLIKQGEGFLATVRNFTPSSGELSEQFDRTTGRQTSAKNLAWSYAALITASRARARARALCVRA